MKKLDHEQQAVTPARLPVKLERKKRLLVAVPTKNISPLSPMS